ncbi:MAG: hypothetical protein QOJ40_2313 [Verrucomicrobiota bacterium]
MRNLIGLDRSMKIREPLRIPIIISGIIAVWFFGWILLSPSQPAYAGKSLSYWMDRYDNRMFSTAPRTNDNDTLEADKALREIGTNAFPFLLRMVARKDSALKAKLIAIYRKQTWLELPIRDAEYYHTKSTYGFAALHGMARPAVPNLIRLLKDQDSEVRAAAAANLALIGPEAEEAIPALLPLLDEQNHGISILNAMGALGQIHRKPDVVLPRLVEFLDGDRKDWNYASAALDAIGRFKSDARHLAPLIASFLNDPVTSKRDSADSALIKVDPEMAQKIFKAKAESN